MRKYGFSLLRIFPYLDRSSHWGILGKWGVRNKKLLIKLRSISQFASKNIKCSYRTTQSKQWIFYLSKSNPKALSILFWSKQKYRRIFYTNAWRILYLYWITSFSLRHSIKLFFRAKNSNIIIKFEFEFLSIRLFVLVTW